MDDLDRFFASNRADLERAIQNARAELEVCRDRCRDLDSRIRAAEAVLGGVDRANDASRPLPTLRAAIRLVLSEEPQGLPAPEIAHRITARDLYRRPNREPVDIGQIHNRVHHYPKEFIRDSGRIRLA